MIPFLLGAQKGFSQAALLAACVLVVGLFLWLVYHYGHQEG